MESEGKPREVVDKGKPSSSLSFCAKIFARTKFSNKTKKLARVLNLMNLILLGIAGTIGAGAYSVVGFSVSQAGPSAVLTVALVGVMCIFTSLPFAEFAANNHSTGYAFAYITEACGELLGYTCGILIVVSDLMGCSVICRCLAKYLVSFLTTFSITIPTWLYDSKISNSDFLNLNILAGVLIILLSILILMGMKKSTTVSNIITGSNVCILLLCVIVGSFYVSKDYYQPFFPKGFRPMFDAIGSVFFMYLGFETLTCFTEEAERPERDVPLALAVVLLIAILVYGGLAAILAGLAPYNTLGEENSLLRIFKSYGLTKFALLINLGSLLGLSSTTLSNMLSMPRVFYSIARNNLLPPIFQHINEKTHVPDFCIIVSGLACFFCSTFLDVKGMIDVCSVTGLWVVSLVDLSVVIVRYTPPSTKEGNSEALNLPGFSFTSGTFISLLCFTFYIASIIVGFSIFYSWHWALTTLGSALLVGISLYLYCQKQVNVPKSSPCPWVPLFPFIGCLSFSLLGTSISLWAWGSSVLIMAIIIVTYFCYGFHKGCNVITSTLEIEDDKSPQPLLELPKA